MTTRDTILDGALEVMQRRGMARTTTKEIARASGFSEAALYKLFTDKEDIFLGVLKERLPRVAVVSNGIAALVGTASVKQNLGTMVEEIEHFYEASLPLAMSLFSDVALLAKHREALRSRGAGPEVVVERVTEYLRAEQNIGRVGANAPIDGAAMALVGGCMHRAFLTSFNDGGSASIDARAFVGSFADGILEAVLPSLAL